MMMRIAMRLGVMDAGLVCMLVGMQTVTVRDMGVMRGFFVVAVFIMIRSFAMMDRRFFVMLGGFAMMFSAFMNRRHEIVLRCDNDGKTEWTATNEASFIGRNLIRQSANGRKYIYFLIS